MDKKSLIKISVLILAVVGLTTAIFLLPKRITTRQRAAFSTAEISLTPASGSQTTNQQFDVELKIKTNGGAKVAVTDLYFLYDNSKLEVVSFDNSTSAYGADNTTITSTPQAGSIRITGAKMSNFPPATGDTFTLGKFHLKGKVDGTATLQLDMTRSSLTGEGPLVTPPAQQDDNISFNSLTGSYTFTQAQEGDHASLTHNIPDRMVVGQNYTLMITAVNTGSTTWSDPGGTGSPTNKRYKLAWNYSIQDPTCTDSFSPTCECAWKVASSWKCDGTTKTGNCDKRENLAQGETIAPGGQKVWTISVHAPTTPGTYPIKLAMIAEGAFVFPDAGIAKNVIVGAAATSTPIPTATVTPSACTNPPVPTFASDAPANDVQYNIGATVALKVNQITQKCGNNNAFYVFNAVFSKSDGTTATWGGAPLPNPSFSVGPFGITGDVAWKVKSIWYDGAARKESAWTQTRNFKVVACSVPVPAITLSTASVVCNATPTPVTITISPVTPANCDSGLTLKYRVHHTSVPDAGQSVTVEQNEGTIPLLSATVPEWSTGLVRTNPGYKYTQSITGGTLFNTRVRKVYVEAALFSGTGTTPVVRSGVSGGIAVQVGGTCPRPTGTVTPIPTVPANVPVLNFKIKFQEVTAEAADQKVKIRVNKGSFNKEFADVNVTSDQHGNYSGSVTLTGVPVGSGYTVFIKGPKHLAKKFCKNGQTRRCLAGASGEITIALGPFGPEGGGFNFAQIPLEPGDLPNPNDNGQQDGVANSVDYSLVVNRWNSTTAADLAIADVDLNGVINAYDSEYIRRTIATRYEDEE